MASKNFYIKIVVRVGFLSVIALLLGWLIFAQQLYIPGIFILLVFTIQVIELIHFLNRTNQKIAFFFDAVRNEDSTLNFPENTGNRSLNELNASLNKVNDLIKKVKFELQEQEQYFKTILEHVSIGIITFSENGNIYLSNTAAQKLLNREHLTHINQIKQFDSKLFTAVKELQPEYPGLVNIKGKTGMVQLSLRSAIFKTKQQSFKLVAIQDIKSELETNELESWIKLIRVLTHEIMNSVAPITSLSETILSFYKNLDGKTPSVKIIGNTIKGLEVINERGAGLISFVETYRKLTRLPQPDKKPIRLGEFFDSTITLINYKPEKDNVKIIRKVIPRDLEVVADKKQLSQVLINLIKNSLEALKNNKNGEIVLKGEINKNHRAQISVIDNGPGIPEELQDKIFVPFFTTKELGSGIGLSLSRQIMQLHGGSITVKSNQSGTVFTLVF